MKAITTDWTDYKNSVTNYTTKGKATALAYSKYKTEKALTGTAKNYTANASHKCEGGVVNSDGASVDKNVTECEALCTTLKPWTDGSATITAATDKTMCYGF